MTAKEIREKAYALLNLACNNANQNLVYIEKIENVLGLLSISNDELCQAQMYIQKSDTFKTEAMRNGDNLQVTLGTEAIDWIANYK